MKSQPGGGINSVILARKGVDYIVSKNGDWLSGTLCVSPFFETL
jgi:hypothetical protein